MVNFNCTFGISLLNPFLAFAVTLQLSSEHTEKEATGGTDTLVMIQAEASQKKGYFDYFSVGDASVLFDSFTRTV